MRINRKEIGKSRIFSMMVLTILLLLFSFNNSFAETELKESPFTLEVSHSLISLKAEKASFKEILKELEKKSGIKITVLEGVDDKKVSLKIDSLPTFAVSTILESMKIENFAVLYDKQVGNYEVYILPSGKDIADFIKGKPVIKSGNFAKGNANRIKGRQIASITKGNNKLPIRYVKDEVLLKFHLGVTKEEIEDILDKYNLDLIVSKKLSKIGYVKVRIPDGRDVISVIKEIGDEHKLKVPEPNYILSVLTASDPFFSSQWYISDINFDKAWDRTGNENLIKVAVIDSGIDAKHPDLKEKILSGYDFVNDDRDPTDDHGHGTFVSGIIAATANDIGIKGLYDYAKIIPIKVIDKNGLGTYEDTAKGIIFAADQGAKVINLSIGDYAYSFMLQDAVDYALSKGCVVVAAGGNDGIEQAIYPAAYPDVIGVSALGYNGQIWSNSNSGRHIDVSAPGMNILSTGLDESYVYASGTSASAPMVSGLAAMLVSEKTDLSSSVIERLIMQSANDLGDEGRDKVYGSGEIDAFAALEQEVEPFHDVSVRSVSVEPIVFEKEKPTYIVANIENTGTYKEEEAEVVLYGITGEQRREIGRKKAVPVIDKITVTFEWKPEESKENIKFEVAVVSVKDSNSSNDSKTTYIFTLQESDGLYTLYKVGPPVHQWIAYQAYKLLPDNTPVKSEIYSYIGATSDQDTILSINFNLNATNWANNDDDGSSIIEGVWEEDIAPRWSEHFWEVNTGYDVGLWLTFWQRSALVKAQEDFWSQIISEYTNGKKIKAYYLLGRLTHLLEDMSVPPHTLNDAHPPGDLSAYEEYTAATTDNSQGNYKNVTSSDATSVSYSTNIPSEYYMPSSYKNVNSRELSGLFYNLAETSNDYDTNDEPGEIDSGDYTFWNARVQISNLPDGADIVQVDRLDFFYNYKSTLNYETDYEFDNLENRVYLYDSFYYHPNDSFNNSTDRLRVYYYLNGSYVYEDFYNIDEAQTPNGFNWVPSSVLKRHHWNDLGPKSIKYVAALYQLFWDTTHPPSINDIRLDSPLGCLGDSNREWIDIYGEWFLSTSKVALHDGTIAYEIPEGRTDFVDDTNIRVCAGVRYTSNWTAQIKNPVNSSNIFSFIVPAPGVPTVSISANPSSIASGGSSTISWSSTNSTSCTASGGWSGVKGISGSEAVTPGNTTTYTLTCTGSGGSANNSITVIVSAGTLPPMVSLGASPDNVTSGQQVGLGWSTSFATSCTASNGWSGSKSLSGNEAVFPTVTTTYTLTCTGAGGTNSDSVTVNVGTPVPVSLTAVPSTIIASNSSTLSWDTNGMDFCTASDGWSGAKALSGNTTVSPSSNTTYTLTCNGSGGTATELVQNGEFYGATTEWTTGMDFYADSIVSNCLSCPGYAYLSSADRLIKNSNNLVGWIYQDIYLPATASSITLNYSVSISTLETTIFNVYDSLITQIKTTSGTNLALVSTLSNLDAGGYRIVTFDLSPYSGQTIRLEFLGSTNESNGTVFRIDNVSISATISPAQYSDSASVTVILPPPPTLTLSAVPDSINSGDSSFLSWSSTNTTSCNASGGWSGAQVTSGSQTVYPSQNTTYSLSCTGLGGSVSRNATVAVTPPSPTVSLSASPATINEGDTSTLTWSTTNATSCTAYGEWGGEGSKATSGSQIVSPASTASYVLSCSGAGGTSSDTATIVVNPIITISITATDATAGEPSDPGTFRVSRTGSTSASLTVYYASSGTATSPSDYNSLPGSVTISAGYTTANITITPIDDSLVEGDETVIVTLSPNSNYQVGSSSNATVIITDNDVVPSVTAQSATNITPTTALLNADFDPYGLSTTHYFEYGTTDSYGSATININSGPDVYKTNSNISGLTPNTTYHYRFVVSDSAGTTYGSDETFITTNATVIYIEPNASCGTENSPCYSVIQDGIDMAGDEVTINVAQGTYYENILIPSSINVLLIQGGWSSDFSTRSENPSLTVIDGDTTGDGIGDDSVITISAASGVDIIVSIEGFTIQNGNTDYGGGIYIDSYSSGIVTLILNGNIISNNTVTAFGGGIGAFSQNSGSSTSVTLTNNIITGNNADITGSGIHAHSEDSGNTTLTLVNNTIAGNAAINNGGGLRAYSYSAGVTNVTLTNNIIWGNTASNGGDIAIRQPGGTTAVASSYNNIADIFNDPEYPGTYNDLGNNIDADPLFENTTSENYHLTSRSLCLDAGTDVDAPSTDFEGDTRPFDGDGDTVATTDIGADEFVGPLPPDIGDVNNDGTMDIVDALFIARYLIELPVSNFNPDVADVNCDGSINIVDALFIARYLIGLPVPGWCGP